jgi:hypothetical protein
MTLCGQLFNPSRGHRNTRFLRFDLLGYAYNHKIPPFIGWNMASSPLFGAGQEKIDTARQADLAHQA